jgi:hypothetical protein
MQRSPVAVPGFVIALIPSTEGTGSGASASAAAAKRTNHDEENDADEDIDELIVWHGILRYGH